ncbi:hypothetical protein QAD02_007785 [Eretmocerus hayati]|uniref:Uncharacterized protein n=1 Tax=Eretmocerus hayati TaxID=131215 RepID=A0ACC2N5X5_9HYME|nr:hypothetical protein QAD02_007785 [Eretmocerus hayati]
MDCVVSVSTGLKRDDRVNCHQVFEIGSNFLSGTYGKKFDDIKLQQNNRVISLGVAQSSVVVDNDSVRIDPTLLFRRLAMIIKNEEDMREQLKLELAPYPKALFDRDGMSKTSKHKFIDNFTVVSGVPDTSGASNVVDVGLLLHRITWEQNENTDDILKKYVNYVKKHFSQDTTIVFDWYPEIPQARHIESLERARRFHQKHAREVSFQKGMKIPLLKDEFLLNEENENSLILVLREELDAAGFTTLQAEGDADIPYCRNRYNSFQRTEKTLNHCGGRHRFIGDFKSKDEYR